MTVSIATGYGMENWIIGEWFPVAAGNFSPWHHVQTGSGAHPDSYPIGTRGSFPGGEAAGVW